jgi:hypothetical protein
LSATPRVWLSLYRLFLSIGTLHPQVATIGYQWRRGDSLASETPREHGIDRQDVYLRSPIKLIHDGAPGFAAGSQAWPRRANFRSLTTWRPRASRTI